MVVISVPEDNSINRESTGCTPNPYLCLGFWAYGLIFRLYALGFWGFRVVGFGFWV